MMIGRTRLGLGPLRDLAQLESTLASLRRIPGVGTVTVEAFEDRRALLTAQVLRPVDLPGELRLALGGRLRSCVLAADRVEVELEDVPAPDSRVRAGGARARARGDDRAPDAPWRRGPWADPATSPWPERERVWDAVASTVVLGEDGIGAPRRVGGAPRGGGAGDAVTAARLADVAPDGTPGALERAAGASGVVLSALESMADVAILVFDRDLRFRASAGSAVRRHGHRPEDLVGRRAPDVLGSAAWARLRAGCEAALRGGTSTLVHRAAGVVYETELRPVVEDGVVVGGVAISRDVTARSGEDRDPGGAVELYERSFVDAPVAKALISPDGRWLRVNHRLCELLGRDEASLMRCRLQELTHPDDAALDASQGRELLDGVRSRYAVHKRYLRRDGRVVPARLEVSLVRDPDGAPRWFVFEFVALDGPVRDRPSLPVGRAVA